MAFKMKGSPHKMGKIQGTSGHASALKTKEDLQHLRDMEHDEEGNHLGRYDRKKEMDKDGNPLPMKSPLEQKKIIEGIKKFGKKVKEIGDKYDTGEKVAEGVKKAVKKKVAEYKPVKTTEVTSDDDKTTATTTKSKKKLFGGKKTTTTSTSRGKEDVDFTRGDMTTTTTRNKRRGGGKKKEVTIDPTTGKKTVTKYKKDGTVKSTKVKKGEYGFKRGKSNKSTEKAAIREAEKEN